MTNRSLYEIIALMLDFAVAKEKTGRKEEGIRPTKMINAAGLSFSQYRYYLTVLLRRDLISFNEKTEDYTTTEKGLQLLARYNEMLELLDGSLLTKIKNNSTSTRTEKLELI